MVYRRTPLVQERLSAGRERLLAEAHALVATDGLGWTVAELASRAGVATGTVYRRFPDGKAELLAEVFRRASGREVGQVEEAVQQAGPGLRERVGAAAEVFARRALRAPRLAFALIAEPADPVVDAERLVFRRAYLEVFRRALLDAGIPALDAEVTAAGLVGALAEALVGPLAAPPSDVAAQDALVAAVRALAVRALPALPPPAPPTPARSREVSP